MEGPFYHFLVALPIFALALMFVVLPPLQWLSSRIFDRRFVLRFSGAWNPADKNQRWDVIFSVIAFVVSLGISFIVLQVLIWQGLLPPLR